MKSLSFSLVLIMLIMALAVSNSSAHNNINNNNNNNLNHKNKKDKKHKIKCNSGWLRLVPCVPQLIEFSLGWSRNPKIDSKCCDTVVELFNSCHTHHLYQRKWFVRAHKSCSENKARPALPPPPAAKKVCSFSTTSSCSVELNSFEHKASKRISGSCCSDVLELGERTEPGCFWNQQYKRCIDYCRTHH